MTTFVIVVTVLYGLSVLYNYRKFIEDYDAAYGGAFLMDATLLFWGLWVLLR